MRVLVVRSIRLYIFKKRKKRVLARPIRGETRIPREFGEFNFAIETEHVAALRRKFGSQTIVNWSQTKLWMGVNADPKIGKTRGMQRHRRQHIVLAALARPCRVNSNLQDHRYRTIIQTGFVDSRILDKVPLTLQRLDRAALVRCHAILSADRIAEVISVGTSMVVVPGANEQYTCSTVNCDNRSDHLNFHCLKCQKAIALRQGEMLIDR